MKRLGVTVKTTMLLDAFRPSKRSVVDGCVVNREPGKDRVEGVHVACSLDPVAYRILVKLDISQSKQFRHASPALESVSRSVMVDKRRTSFYLQ